MTEPGESDVPAGGKSGPRSPDRNPLPGLILLVLLLLALLFSFGLIVYLILM